MRPFECLYRIANAQRFNGLIRTVSHQDRSPASDAVQVPRRSLVLLPITLKLTAADLDQPILEPPHAELAVPAVARTEDLLVAIDELLRFLVRATQDQRAPVGSEREPDQQIGFAGARLAAVEELVRITVERQMLRAWVWQPRQVPGALFDQPVDLRLLFRR